MTVELSPRMRGVIQARLLRARDQQRERQKRDLSNSIETAWKALERGEGIDGLKFFQLLEGEERTLRRRR